MVFLNDAANLHILFHITSLIVEYQNYAMFTAMTQVQQRELQNYSQLKQLANCGKDTASGSNFNCFKTDQYEDVSICKIC